MKRSFLFEEKRCFKLGTASEFSDRFRCPIENGQHRDSSSHLVSYMRRRVYTLHQHLQTTIHRRNFDVLRAFLPPKFEYGYIHTIPIPNEDDKKFFF